MNKIDEDLQSAFSDPKEQMGVLMMAQILAFRRVLAHHGVADRNRRRLMIRTASMEFATRLAQFAADVDIETILKQSPDEALKR